AVFAYGAYLAYGVPKLLQAYLIGFTTNIGVALRLQETLHTIGSVSGSDLLRGEWWRLLTSCFVHAGLLHLGLNMFALRSIGAFVEQTWGRWRFLVIYFLSGWGGSCLAMAYAPKPPTVGASGALFGLFATVIVGLLLYGKHLPPGMRRRAWRGVLINVVLLALLSWGLRSYLSHWGHLGGALAGALTALVLHVQRFGPPGVRWLALAALAPLPWAGLVVIDRARAR